MIDSWASWAVPVLFGLLMCVFIGGLVLFIIGTIQFLRLRTYSIRKHPSTWLEFVKSGHFASWLPTNIRDFNILRRNAQDDHHLLEMVRTLDKTRSRFIRTSVLWVVIFLVALVVVIYLSILQKGA